MQFEENCGTKDRLLYFFETATSSRDKGHFMQEARAYGCRVCRYCVATDDSTINVDRVHRPVEQGGHPVPERKVRERYVRLIGLMTEASRAARRADVFDNSGSRRRLLVQLVDGDQMQIALATLP